MSNRIVGSMVERCRSMARTLTLRMTPSAADGAMGIPGAFVGKMASLIAVKPAATGRATLLPPPMTLLWMWFLQGSFKLLFLR